MKKLLLINPKFPESYWSFSWALEAVIHDKKAVNSPLGLATLAALTPSDWEIRIIDENVEPIDWSLTADIVGVCGMGVQAPRQREIMRHFRNRGMYVVAGGSYASLCPEEYETGADSIISGESEYIWPKFCADFEADCPQKLYRETGEVALTDSPPPRYDLLPLHLYQKVSLQFSRGCPFKCEFCDIIVMFGRKPRSKTMEQIGKELDLLREKRVTSVFFVDDNLIGNISKAKELLRFLVGYQKKHNYRFSFGTEASINMAADADLMGLFRQSNFEWVFIGIETPSLEGLKETGKSQNLREDLITSIRTIYSYGIDIFAGFIVGFDSDDKTIFDRQHDFIVSSGIAVSMVGLLTALPKTPLYKRLKEAGRLRENPSGGYSDNTRLQTNIIPLNMSYDELVAGYQNLHFRLTQENVIFKRIANKLKYLKNPIISPHLSFKQKAAYFLRLILKGILPGGRKMVFNFLRSLASVIVRPQGMAVVVTDWVAVLSLRAYQSRHIEKSLLTTKGSMAELETLVRHLNTVLARKFDDLVQKGLVLRVQALKEGQRIWIDLKESLELKIHSTLSSAIRWTLKRSREIVVIDCQSLKESSSVQLSILLKKLKRYRHRVHINITEGLYQKLRDELAPFGYTLVSPWALSS